MLHKMCTMYRGFPTIAPKPFNRLSSLHLVQVATSKQMDELS